MSMIVMNTWPVANPRARRRPGAVGHVNESTGPSVVLSSHQGDMTTTTVFIDG
jgi:hypothetical protein